MKQPQFPSILLVGLGSTSMRLLFACIFIFVGTLGAFAERREALVFGANTYRSLRHLENANGDAEAMKVRLERLGFQVTIEKDRDLKGMRRALADFGEDAKGADVALVFYSGHGIEIAGDNRLLPVDADASSLDALKASTLPLEEVRDLVTSTSKIGLIVLDACRDNPFGAATTADGRSATPLKPEIANIVRPGLGRMGRAENILFAFSAAPGQSASDGNGGNSPFTAALVKYLGTNGLEIRSVLTLVQQEVYDETRGKQLPYVESGLPQTFFASTTKEQLPERERLLLAMAEVTPDIRGEVEKIAASQGMPLAPLYGALVAAELTSHSSEDREKKLTDAAQAFIQTRDQLKRLSSADPQVRELRVQAETSLSLGAFKEARQALAKAIAVDAEASDALAGNLVNRRLSEAASHISDAGVARAQLNYQGAIAAMAAAAALHDRIEGEAVPDAARGDRDRLLMDLGDLQSSTGNSKAALDTYQRMLRAGQLRKAKAPGEPDADRDLAAAHQRIGDMKIAQGDIGGALISYKADLAISERLAADEPNDSDRQRDVEVGYFKVGNVKMSRGDSAGALSAFQTSAAIARRLAETHPDNSARQRDLGAIQSRLGDVKMTQGDLSGALVAYEESISIAGKLAAREPQNPEWQQHLGLGQEKIGDVRMAQGNSTAALAAYQADLESAVWLATSDPNNTDWQRDVSIAQDKIGDVKGVLGDLSGALEAHKASLAIAETLAARDPNNMLLQRDLAVSQQRIGDLKAAQGDGPGALAAYESAVANGERLFAADPDNAVWARGLALAQQRIGDMKLGQSDNVGALRAYEAGLEIVKRLAANDPSNVTWLRDLSIARQRLGDVKMAEGDSDYALALYGDSLNVALRLADSNPQNIGWQRDIALGQEKIGDVLMVQGNFAGALAAYQESLAVGTRLSNNDPGNANWLRGMGITQSKIADVLLAQGDLAGAQIASQAYLDVAVRLVTRDPHNAGWQRDLMVAHFKVAKAGKDPRKHFNAALQIALETQQGGHLSQADAFVPQMLRDELASLPNDK